METKEVRLEISNRSNTDSIHLTLITTRISLALALALLLLIMTTFSVDHTSSSPLHLSPDFYSSSCPNVELLVETAVRSATSSDPTLPAKLLRLLFHDCMVEGCDGSVLMQGGNGNGTERSDPANRSLGGFEVVERAKRLLEILCPATVSCADILVLAARDAVQISGGPSVAVPLGRRDGRISLASNVRPNMVDTSFTVDEMSRLFSSKGLSLDDLVILSGAHTIGSAHCSAFRERFKDGTTGDLVPVDGSLEKSFAMALIKQCPADASGSVTVDNDPITASLFDNQYYRNLLDGTGLFKSDAVLVGDSRTRRKVEDLANDQGGFFANWEESFLRLTSIGVKTEGEGEIHTSCTNNNN